MFDNTKCECGHQNPVGTVLCEACGKPQFEDGTSELLEMRYEGASRRSMKSNPNVLDRVWNFFSSVKIAVYLIAIVLLVSMVGTIYPQENVLLNVDPASYYQDNYGQLGYWYYVLGLSRTYSSWWYVTLMLMIATSLVICSIDRVVPLYRALSNQQARKHVQFLTRQKISFRTELSDSQQVKPFLTQVTQHLQKRHYRIVQEGDALLAEKYRFSRWGPYVNHIGLILFIVAILMRSIPGWHMDQYIGFVEGETRAIPQTPYYLKNEKFMLELYEQDEMSEEFQAQGKIVPKSYETQAVLYRCIANCQEPSPVLEQVHSAAIVVNQPLQYEDLLAYQFNYKYTPMLISVQPRLVNKVTNEVVGQFKLPMRNPNDEYQVGPYTLKLKGYFPHFGLDEQGNPVTLSNEPEKPAFIFTITGPELATGGEPYIYFPRQIDKQVFRQDDINGEISKKLELSVGNMEDVEIANYTSYLNIRVDKAIPYIWVAATISMIGLLMGFYWQHRRIWIRIDNCQLTLGAHTNKNWVGFRNEIVQALQSSNVSCDSDCLQIRRKPS